jgi:hypothetical protein
MILVLLTRPVQQEPAHGQNEQDKQKWIEKDGEKFLKTLYRPGEGK